jgi:hypothetical protein
VLGVPLNYSRAKEIDKRGAPESNLKDFFSRLPLNKMQVQGDDHDIDMRRPATPEKHYHPDRRQSFTRKLEHRSFHEKHSEPDNRPGSEFCIVLYGEHSHINVSFPELAPDS